MVTALRVIGAIVMIVGFFNMLINGSLRLLEPEDVISSSNGTMDFIVFLASVISGVLFLAFAKMIELLEKIAKDIETKNAPPGF